MREWTWVSVIKTIMVWLISNWIITPVRAQMLLGMGSAKATVPECVQEITADSVLLFYDLRYNLTPPACADIRRHARVNSKGDFQGEVRDYTIVTSELRDRLYYEQGQRNGLYATYYPNGKLAMQGNFTRGEPTGTWEFWFPNGQHQQTFEWTGQLTPRLRVLAAWDSTGQASVTNGNGVWQGVMQPLKCRYGGLVQNGLPQGIWESHALETDKLLLRETYEQGTFRGGKAFDVPASMSSRYKTRSLLEPQVNDPTERSDQVRLGLNCTGIRADRERLQAMRQQMAGQANAHVAPPKPPGNTTSYLKTLLGNLNQTNQRNQWVELPDTQQFIVKGSIDSAGFLRIGSGQGGSGIAVALEQAVGSMGRWQPALVDGKPVAGAVSFIMMKQGAMLYVTMQTRAVY